MTAEQHTSIAHSDGDTPEPYNDNDWIPTDEYLDTIDSEFLLDGLEDAVEHYLPRRHAYRMTVERRLARPTPDQIRAAVEGVIDTAIETYYPLGFPYESNYDQMFKEIEDDCISAVAALFDAEVGL